VILYGSQIITKGSKEELELTTPLAPPPIDKNWSKFAQDIFTYQNTIRKNPKSFIAHLEK